MKSRFRDILKEIPFPSVFPLEQRVNTLDGRIPKEYTDGKINKSFTFVEMQNKNNNFIMYEYFLCITLNLFHFKRFVLCYVYFYFFILHLMGSY